MAAAWPDDHGGVVRVVEVSTGSVVREFAWPGASAVSFSPDGAEVAVISSSSGAVLDVATGRQVAALDANLGSLFDVAWSPDGRLIAVAREAGGAQVHDAHTGQQVMVLPGHRAQVLAVAWSPDSLRARHRQQRRHDQGVGAVRGWWPGVDDADRRRHPQRLQRRRLLSGRLPRRHEHARRHRAHLARRAGRHRRGGEPAGSGVRSRSRPVHRRRTSPPRHRWPVARSPCGTSARGNASRALGEDGGPAPPAPLGRPLATPSDIVRLAPSPDGRSSPPSPSTPITGADGILPVHDVDGGPDGFDVDVGRRVSDADWSTDGELLAIAGVDRDDVATVSVADRAGRPAHDPAVPRPTRRDRTIHRRRRSPRHRPLRDRALRSRNGRVEVWDWRGEDLLRTFEVDAWVRRCPIRPSPSWRSSPVAKHLDQTVAIWNLDTGERIATLAGHSGFIDDLVFSSDGTRIATASGDGSIRIWDPVTGQEQLTLLGHAGRVYSVSFSPDGRWLASYGAEGTARVWALDHDELAEIARQRVTRRPHRQRVPALPPRRRLRPDPERDEAPSGLR